jgi:hypothetical protein
MTFPVAASMITSFRSAHVLKGRLCSRSNASPVGSSPGVSDRPVADPIPFSLYFFTNFEASLDVFFC